MMPIVMVSAKIPQGVALVQRFLKEKLVFQCGNTIWQTSPLTERGGFKPPLFV
jgi:hypothetical protein